MSINTVVYGVENAPVNNKLKGGVKNEKGNYITRIGG